MTNSMWMTYTLLYFTEVLGMSAHHAGMVMLAGQVTDGLGVVMVGLLFDSWCDSWCTAYGRHKSWHLMGTLCILLSFPFIFRY